MRYFLAFALLAASLMSMSCERRAANGVSLYSGFVPLVAPDTKVLAGLNIEKLKTAPLYRRHQSSLDFPLLDASVERIGLDPRRDISDLVVTWDGRQVVVMARGRFAPQAIQDKLVALGAHPASYKGYELLTLDRNAVSFLDKGIAVGGSLDALHKAMDVAKNDAGTIPKELHDRLRTVPKGDQVWVVSRGGLPFAELPMRSDYASALSNIAGYVGDTSLGIGIDTGAHLIAELSCNSPQGAQRVHDGLRAAVALGRLTTKDDQQDLLRIYDAIQVDQDKETVQVRADFSSDLADKLLSYLTALQR